MSLEACSVCRRRLPVFACPCGKKYCMFCADITSLHNAQYLRCGSCYGETPVGSALIVGPLHCSLCGLIKGTDRLFIHPPGCESLRKICRTCDVKDKEQCKKRCGIIAVCKRCLRKWDCVVYGWSPISGRKCILRWVCPDCGGTIASF